ncbi:MAG: uroporphyrinogen-III synthase [Nitrososphaerota archaeon]|nr:uroporphyrinogen-III synthase [Nitrososphaerota archaeon]
MVVARSREGNVELRAMLAASGVEAASVETIKFEAPEDWSAVDNAVAGIEGFDWVILTSPRAAAVLGERLRRLGGRGKLPKFAAVGPKTAAGLREIGLEASFVPDRYLTSRLGETLPLGQGKRALLFRADIGDKALAETLEGRGFEVSEVAAYRTRPEGGEVDDDALEGADLVVFASPSEVRGFGSRLGPERMERVTGRATAVCIGPVTASAARSAGFGSVVSVGRHTVDALAEKIVELANHA